MRPSEVKPEFDNNRTGIFRDIIGWSNILGLRRLGPTNGPMPLQELIRTIYIMTGFMVSEIAP